MTAGDNSDEAWWARKTANQQRRASLQARAISYLGGACRICGYDRCASALDFHHLDPRSKDFNISEAMTSWDRIKSELDKCVLLCANCHREVHAGFHPEYLELEDGFWMAWDDGT